jgi:ankyrin repeat protein
MRVTEAAVQSYFWFSRGETMRRKNLTIILLFLMVSVSVTGCSRVRQASHTQETDALFRAVRAGSPDTVNALLASPNVDVNAVDEQGNTPLIEAARLGHDQVVSALLIAHADISIKNDESKTALMLAAEGRHDETVRVLTAAGARQ